MNIYTVVVVGGVETVENRLKTRRRLKTTFGKREEKSFAFPPFFHAQGHCLKKGKGSLIKFRPPGSGFLPEKEKTVRQNASKRHANGGFSTFSTGYGKGIVDNKTFVFKGFAAFSHNFPKTFSTGFAHAWTRGGKAKKHEKTAG